jgi:MFS family permease
MFVGLFLGLIPTIIRGVFDINSGLVNGATVFVEPGSAAVAALFVSRISPRSSTQSGAAEIIVGAALVTVAIAARVLPLLVLGGVVGGVGWGSSYSGSLRMLSPLAEPDQRAGLFAAVFTVAYLAFGVPVVIAGQLIPRVGLSSTAIGYCVATGLAATIGLIAESAVGRRRTSRDAAVTRRGEGEILVPVVPDPRLGETAPRQALDGRRLVHGVAVEDDRQCGDARTGTA